MAWGMLLASAYSAYNISEAGSEAKDLSNQNAKFIYDENTEKIRKTKLSQAQTTSQSTSLFGSSGISLQSESVTTYMDELKSNFQKDIDWMEKARASNVSIEQQRGDNAKKLADRKAIGTLVTGVASVTGGK